MVEVSPALLALRQEQSALIRGRGQRHVPVREQLLRVGERMAFEVIFELGEPDLHARTSGVGVGGDVFGEGTRQRRGLADARFHAGSFSRRESSRRDADNGRSWTSISICQNSRSGSKQSVEIVWRAYASPT